MLAFSHLAAWSFGSLPHSAANDAARIEAAARGTAVAMVATAIAPAGPSGAIASNAGLGVSGAASTSSLPTTIDIAWLPDTVQVWEERLVAAGARWRVDPALLAIVMLVESGGNPAARSPAGAVGLMQVMPATAGDIARLRGLAALSSRQLVDPETNIEFGAWYLARQLASFGSADDPDWQRSVELAAVAYNGGPGSAASWQRGGYVPAEARRYRVWVGGMWSERALPTSPTYARWLDAGGAYLVDRARSVLDPANGGTTLASG